MIELFVAPQGTPEGPGMRERPFATLTQARDALRRLRQAGPVGAATVWLRGGTYRLEASFTLLPEDGGTADAPVVYRAWPGEDVRLSGGQMLDGAAFRPVSDPAVLARLDPAVRGQVQCLDLVSVDIADTGGHTSHGFAHPPAPADLDLFCEDRPLPNARWPREGYALTGPVLDAGTKLNDPAGGNMGPAGADAPRGATFTGDAARIRRWARPSDLTCFGMWRRDWAPATIPVAALDAERGLITLGGPSCYGVEEGKHYCVYNALEEISAPGEWAVDRDARVLYLYPPAPLAGARLMVSLLEAPLIALQGASHVILRDLIVEGGRGPGIVIDGDDNLVASCTLRNLGGRGVTVNGARNGVQSCHLHALGQGGIMLAGGDRRQLVAGENYADNNEIHDVNRVCTTYTPGVHLYGCGHRVSHNAIYDGPHNAILLHGNDHLIEYNEIHHVGVDTDDAAAFYMGRNPSEQGNVIQYNYFHHIGSPSGWGTAAIYPDDGASGLTVRGNVFYRCGHAGTACMGAIFNNAGKDHLIENNVFVDCRICLGQMLILQDQWEQFIRGENPNTRYVYDWLYKDVDIRSDVYLRRYPWLADLASNPTSNTVRRNLAVRCGVLVTPADRQRLEDNWMTDEDPGFADLARLDFTLRPEGEAFRRIPGLQPIPFAAMGVRLDEYRSALPPRALVDCRPAVSVQPEVRRPGETAPAVLTLHLANLSDAPASVQVDLWTTHPACVTFPALPEARLSVDLAPGETRRQKVALQVIARPDLASAVGARVSGSGFSLPVPVQPRYRVELSPDAAELPFLRGEETVGTLRLSLDGDALALQAAVRDSPSLPDGTPENFWGSPYLGILAAPAEAADVDAVHQLIFFPHGPGEDGTLWYFAGIRQQVPDAAVRWTAAPAADGWTLSARVPLAALGLNARAAAFRFEAMANLTPAGAKKPALATLFGSKPARLELETLGEARVCPAVVTSAE